MESVSNRNFGLLIAYVIPGFITVNGVALFSTRITHWLGGMHIDLEPSVGGFLYLTIASVFAGLLVTTIRWLLIDSLLHTRGIRKPAWKFERLNECLPAFETLVEIHYRYYQFYSNSIVAMLIFALCRWWKLGFSLLEAILLAVCVFVLFFGARDTLDKYYRRVEALLAAGS